MNRALQAKAIKLQKQIAAAPRYYSTEPAFDRAMAREELSRLCDGVKVVRVRPERREARAHGERERHGRIGAGFLASCMADWDPAARCEIVHR